MTVIQARDHSDLDKRIAKKVASSQESGLILKVEPIEIFSGLDVDVREREKSRLTTSLTLNNWKDEGFINGDKEDCGRGSFLGCVCVLRGQKLRT